MTTIFRPIRAIELMPMYIAAFTFVNGSGCKHPENKTERDSASQPIARSASGPQYVDPCSSEISCAMRLGRIYSAIENYRFHTGRAPINNEELVSWFSGVLPCCSCSMEQDYYLASLGPEKIDCQSVLAYERQGNHSTCLHVLLKDKKGPRVVIVNNAEWYKLRSGQVSSESIPTILRVHSEIKRNVQLSRPR